MLHARIFKNLDFSFMNPRTLWLFLFYKDSSDVRCCDTDKCKGEWTLQKFESWSYSEDP